MYRSRDTNQLSPSDEHHVSWSAAVYKVKNKVSSLIINTFLDVKTQIKCYRLSTESVTDSTDFYTESLASGFLTASMKMWGISDLINCNMKLLVLPFTCQLRGRRRRRHKDARSYMLTVNVWFDLITSFFFFACRFLLRWDGQRPSGTDAQPQRVWTGENMLCCQRCPHLERRLRRWRCGCDEEKNSPALLAWRCVLEVSGLVSAPW